VVVVEPEGQVHTLFVRIDTAAARCRQVALVSGGDRAYIVGRDRIGALDPKTRRSTTHRLADVGRERCAPAVPGGGLAVASERGLRLVDTTTWKVRRRDRAARSVLAGGNTVIATGRDVCALDARTGRARRRAPGHATAVAAGRVYAQPAVLDLRTGARCATHPVFTTAIRIT
jgi:hypothetical protein